MNIVESYCKQIETEAKLLYEIPMPKLTKELFSFYEETGNRTEYEKVYFFRRKCLVTFGMMSVLYGRAKDVKKLEEVIVDVCEEECWALPAHVDRTKVDWKITVDLFASETAQTLAEITTILKDRLTAKVKALAKRELFRRVLTPFYSAAEPYAWWEHCDINWCAVCNGAIGSASIYMIEDKEKLDRCLVRICNSMPYYLNGFGKDGACKEGISYFTYGMTYFVGFAKQVYEYSNGAIDLLETEQVKRIAEFQEKCYFLNKHSLSFSDGSEKDHYSLGLTSFLASRFQTVHIPDLSLAASFTDDPCYRWMGLYRNYIWTKQYFDKENVSNAENKKRGPVILKDTQWYLCESKNGCGFAVKGGNNEEPHNHNDIGSFLFFINEDVFLPDLGAGEYTKDYFHENRYSIFCNSSFGHNVPIINGDAQLEGAEHSCTRFDATENGKVVLDITNAYEKGSIEKLVRTLQFDRKEGSLTIKDEYKPSDQTKSVTEHLISYDEPVICEQGFLVNGKQGNCKIYVSGRNLSVRQVDHALHSGEHKTVYEMIWEADLQKEENEFTIRGE